MTDTPEATVQRIDPPDKLAAVELRIAAIDEDMPREEFLAIVNAATALKKRATEIVKLLNEVAVPYLDHTGPIESGDLVYKNSKTKKVKCRDQRALFEVLLDATGGNVDAICELFAADAIKQGATRTLIGDEAFEQHFETTWSEKVTFKTINQNFITKGKA